MMMRYLLLFFSLVFCFGQTWAQTDTVAYRDTVFNQYFMRDSGWTAGDGTLSVPVPCLNETIWLFGDSYLNHVDLSDTTLPCLFQLRNAIMVQQLDQPDSFLTILDTSASGVDRMPVKINDSDSTFFWPDAGYAKGDTAYIFWYQLVWGSMHTIRTWVSTIDARNFTNSSNILSMQPLTFLPDTVSDIGFGESVLVDSARHFIYVYGAKRDWIVDKPVVARFPIDSSVFSPWEYYDGSQWVSNIDSAANLFNNSDYVTAYSVIKVQNKYIMISQSAGFLSCGLGREIHAWESNTPYGPFTNKTLVYTIEDQYHGHYWVTYNATAHPEFTKNNELLISYNLNGFNTDTSTGCVSECQDVWHDRRKAVGYRPKFVRVPLTLIDSTLHAPDVSYDSVDCHPHHNTGITKTKTDLGIDIYPNPSRSGTFLITISKVSDPVRIRVHNVVGQIVTKTVTHHGKASIHLKNHGVYFVTFYISGSRRSAKIVVY